MKENISYSEESSSVMDQIRDLLRRSELPVEDVDGRIRFVLALDGEKIIGCIGLEQFGSHGLLRSLAVDREYRSTGVGNELLIRLLNFCGDSGIDQLHLLTTTADKYFLKKGFRVDGRENAPEPIKLSSEFSSVCPASAVYMILHL